MVKVNYKDIITTPMVSFCVFVANFEQIHTFSSAFIVKFEYLIAGWAWGETFQIFREAIFRAASIARNIK